jgi:hypothetical protein
MHGRELRGQAVILNVYDLTPANDYLHDIGFGVYHSGTALFLCGILT